MKKLTLILLFSLLLPVLPRQSVYGIPSDTLVIAQVQTGGPVSGTATQEIILLLNSASHDVEVTGWCIEYSSAANGTDFSKLGCIESVDVETELWLSGGGIVSFATQEFSDFNSGFLADFALKSGLAGGGGHVRLIDREGTEVDRVGWGGAVSPEGSATAAHAAGEVLSRDLSSEKVSDSDDNKADFSSLPILSPISSGLYEQTVIIDVCANIEGAQTEVPNGFVNNSGICTEIQLEDARLIITELLPNAPSYDTGQEFIEIYNPTDQIVQLTDYVLQIGPAYTDTFIFLTGTIQPGEFTVVADTISGLTLPNTTASVRLVTPAGSIASETAAYVAPDDDVSWALIDNEWIYTNQITPGSANKPNFDPVESPQTAGDNSVLAPCPAGKFRNPETNRCKNIESVVSQLTPCDADEYRNLDTNRCRKIASATSALVPCREDQFRNPDTNRCKSRASKTSNLVPCDEGQERNPETNRCRKIQDIAGISSSGTLSEVTDIAVENGKGQLGWYMPLAVVSGAGGYALFEWRQELSRKLRQCDISWLRRTR